VQDNASVRRELRIRATTDRGVAAYGRTVAAFTGLPAGSSCMVCGADLWGVERYVSAGMIRVCARCVDTLKQAMDETERLGEIEVVLPQRSTDQRQTTKQAPRSRRCSVKPLAHEMVLLTNS
jgi:hypothetical protein